MPKKPVDLPARIAEILDHVGEVPTEAESPISHYALTSDAAVGMRRYLLRKLDETGHYPAARDKHLGTRRTPSPSSISSRRTATRSGS